MAQRNVTIEGLVQLLRVKPVLSWGISAFILGIAVAINRTGLELNYIDGLIAMAGVVIAQGFASHGLNDVVDWVTGTDKESIGKGTGGSRVIPENKMSVFGTLIVGMVATTVVFFIGVYFYLKYGLPILILTVLAVGMPVIYSVPPFKMAYRPFNEVITVLPSLAGIVVGADIVLSGSASLLALAVGIIHSSFCISWFIVSRLPDYAPDKDVGKVTTVVYLGRENTPLASFAYASIGIFVAGIATVAYHPVFAVTPLFALWMGVGLAKLDVFDAEQASKIRLRNMHITTLHALTIGAVLIATGV